MKLNYTIEGQGAPIILLHGLFGNLGNLGRIARSLSPYYQIIQIDIRNHGQSPWSSEMNYEAMASDVIDLINDLSLDNVSLIGHSMGGKVAMKLAEKIPDYLDQIIILDIAPVKYEAYSHSQVFYAINECIRQKTTDRKSVHNILSQYLDDPTTQFLLKSYKEEHWLFNFNSIQRHYDNILDWQEVPPYFNSILFVKGNNSDYIKDAYQADILLQFPYARIETIEGAGHNLHIDKTQQVVALIKMFLN